MRKRIIISATITALAALSAITTTIATAALPEFSADKTFPIKYTATSGSGTLSIAGNPIQITCEDDLVTKGEITNATGAGTFTIAFLKCTALGIFGAHSLGDAEGTILVTAKTSGLCYINKAEKRVGIVITQTGKTHIEVAGKLTVLEGSLIGELTPVNKLTLEPILSLKATEAGKQEVLKCEGGTELHLTSAESEGTPVAAAYATIDKLGILEQTAELLA
jgi:hypothetical protein